MVARFALLRELVEEEEGATLRREVLVGLSLLEQDSMGSTGVLGALVSHGCLQLLVLGILPIEDLFDILIDSLIKVFLQFEHPILHLIYVLF